MNRRIKSMIIFITLAALVVGGYWGINKYEQYKKNRITQTYYRLNAAVLLVSENQKVPHEEGEYYRELYGAVGSAYDIHYDLYLALKMYENQTGTILSYERVVEYMSQEFEPDGTSRLYNNGRHADMEKYVDWFWDNEEREDELLEYIDTIREMFIDFCQGIPSDHEYKWVKNVVLANLSTQMLDELVKKEADPEYYMDLLSLFEQEQETLFAYHQYLDPTL